MPTSPLKKLIIAAGLFATAYSGVADFQHMHDKQREAFLRGRGSQLRESGRALDGWSYIKPQVDQCIQNNSTQPVYVKKGPSTPGKINRHESFGNCMAQLRQKEGSKVIDHVVLAATEGPYYVAEGSGYQKYDVDSVITADMVERRGKNDPTWATLVSSPAGILHTKKGASMAGKVTDCILEHSSMESLFSNQRVQPAEACQCLDELTKKGIPAVPIARTLSGTFDSATFYTGRLYNVTGMGRAACLK